MRFISATPTPLAWVATFVLVGCESHNTTEQNGAEAAAIGLSTYFPPSESNGGWRKTTDPARVRDLGLDAGKLNQLGQYFMSLPYENYSTGVSGYQASNKAAIVVKGGWIVGEYYNQASARTG